MRKAIKEKIMQLMDSIEERIKKLLNTPQEQCYDELEEIQNAIVIIGEVVEKTENESKELIIKLEEFTEVIYTLYTLVDKSAEFVEQIISAAKECKAIREALREQLSEILEIIFMPYKASMWDAMESVYHAVKKEQNCRVIVLPVPYYNIGENREILSTEYEGDMFPDDVRIKDYRQYHISEMCPDVIFIHNPYDEYNSVTQLKEEYFSSQLAKYTPHLVYIPYKVCSGVEKDIYCVMPGVYHSWRTFVQSNRVRDVYIKYHKPEKIVALGSPKVDSMVNLDKRILKVPDKWKKIITDKKVFLLNTHLSSIINHTEEMFSKLLGLISLFKQRDDIILLWRPHPLSIQTIKSMKPKFLESYLFIISEFKQLGIGIYDDTADMHRAIALSDAYIGDWSSLVSLYGVTGKPVMVLNIYANNRSLLERNKESIRFMGAVLEGNIIYFCARDFNEIFKYDMNTEILTHIGSVYTDVNCMVKRVYKWENQLFLITTGKRETCFIYGLDNGESRPLPFGNERNEGGNIEYIRWRERIYIIEKSGNSFGYIDMKEEKYIAKSQVAEQIKEVVLAGADLYFLIRESNIILKYNIEEEQWKTFDFKYLEEEITNVAYENGRFYFLTREWSIFICNEEKQGLYQQKRIDICLEESSFEVNKILVWHENIYIIPFGKGSIIHMEKKTYKINTIQFPDTVEFDSDNVFPLFSRFSSFEFTNESLLLYPFTANRLLEVCLTEGELKERQMRLPDNLEQDILLKNASMGKLKSIYYEDMCGIEYFINIVTDNRDILKEYRKEEFGTLFGNIEGSSGKEIWNYIKKNL